MEKNAWSAATYASIAWDSYAQAQSKLTPTARTFIVKFTVGWLPVGTRATQIGLSTTAACPFCLLITEDLPHLLQCQRSTLTHADIVDELRSHLDITNTAPLLRQNLVTNVTKWLKTTDSWSDPAQHTIGDLNFFRGYIPTQWIHDQQQFLDLQPTCTSSSLSAAQKWGSQLIAHLWSVVRARWLHRNDALHRGTDQSDTLIRQDLHARVHTQYEKAEHLNHIDRDLFRMPLAQRLAQSIIEITTWLRNTLSVVDRGLLDMGTQVQTGCRDLRHYFTHH
jgi:hypothetical protein